MQKGSAQSFAAATCVQHRESLCYLPTYNLCRQGNYCQGNLRDAEAKNFLLKLENYVEAINNEKRYLLIYFKHILHCPEKLQHLVKCPIVNCLSVERRLRLLYVIFTETWQR